MPHGLTGGSFQLDEQEPSPLWASTDPIGKEGQTLPDVSIEAFYHFHFYFMMDFQVLKN